MVLASSAALCGGLGTVEPFLTESSPESVDQTGSAVLLRNEQLANNIAAAVTPKCERRITGRPRTFKLPLLTNRTDDVHRRENNVRDPLVALE